MKAVEQSYLRHANHMENELLDESRIRISQSWFDDTTADYWRHSRMYECIDCLTHRADKSWLTVGDGRWGLDSIRIRKKGFSNVMATDISEHLLREAKRRGYINDYRVENAEHLTLGDRSYDFVFCKESCHHFPRPYLALYEMLRVARQAVFLIEPNDYHPSLNKLQKYYQGKGEEFAECYRNSYEGCGNYVYALSRRELEKVALGLNLPQIVFKGLNDHYIRGCEFEPADPGNETFRQIRDNVAACDVQCESGERDYALLMAGIFKQPIDALAQRAFAYRGWQIVNLKRNPHG